MRNSLIAMVTLLMMTGVVFSADIQTRDLFLREEFNDLERWKPLYFPKIKEHSKYSIENNGGAAYLKAESLASASGIIFKKEFNVYAYPKMKWKWKVSNVYKNGNALEKSGDDYPLRVYVIFKYDPENASFSQKLKYGIARKLYGKYPPHSSLNYIWANRRHRDRIILNSYASEVRMFPLQSGAENAGRWVEEEVNIIDDYQRAFGEDPPETASLAVMNDSDNTGEGSLSYIDFIEIYR